MRIGKQALGFKIYNFQNLIDNLFADGLFFQLYKIFFESLTYSQKLFPFAIIKKLEK